MTSRKDHLDLLAISILLACCLFWGFQQVLVKATIPEVPPVLQAFIRFAGALLILWLWCVIRSISLFEHDGSLAAGLFAGALFADRKSTRLNSSHLRLSRMPSSA